MREREQLVDGYRFWLEDGKIHIHEEDSKAWKSLLAAIVRIGPHDADAWETFFKRQTAQQDHDIELAKQKWLIGESSWK